MRDKATVLTTIFTRVDDTMKGSAVIQLALQRPGPAPQFSDSELVTLALYQERIGEPREDHFFRLHQASLLPFFPGLNERSRYNRRKRDLWSVILAVRVSLQIVLDALELEETAVIDSAPVPCVGYKRGKQHSDFLGTADYGRCSSKALTYFGCKLHCVVSLTGVVMSFMLTPASPYDNQPVVELLDSFSYHLKRVLGEKASNDAELQSFLKQSRSLELFAPVKVNQLTSHHNSICKRFPSQNDAILALSNKNVVTKPRIGFMIGCQEPTTPTVRCCPATAQPFTFDVRNSQCPVARAVASV